MKRLAAAVLAAASLFAAVGCSSDQPTKTDRYVSFVRDRTDFPRSVTRHDLVKAGHMTCELLDQGYTLKQIVYVIVSDSPDITQQQAHDVGVVLGASVKFFCPRYLPSRQGTNA